jgi:hypothetical protein
MVFFIILALLVANDYTKIQVFLDKLMHLQAVSAAEISSTLLADQ